MSSFCINQFSVHHFSFIISISLLFLLFLIAVFQFLFLTFSSYLKLILLVIFILKFLHYKLSTWMRSSYFTDTDLSSLTKSDSSVLTPISTVNYVSVWIHHSIPAAFFFYFSIPLFNEWYFLDISHNKVRSSNTSQPESGKGSVLL